MLQWHVCLQLLVIKEPGEHKFTVRVLDDKGEALPQHDQTLTITRLVAAAGSIPAAQTIAVKALDNPMALKMSVPGSNVIEVQFENPPDDWEQRLRTLDNVTSVQREGAGMFRVLTGSGSRTTTELVEMAVAAGVALKTLSVQNTTLDDVFVHYTGRQLRDELQKAYAFTMPQRPGLQP